MEREGEPEQAGRARVDREALTERSCTRREMISLFIASAVHVAASRIEAAQPQPGRWGVQLYTVRDLIARDAASTIAAIAAMGYKELEILQPTLPVVGPLAQKHGLTIVAAHLDERTSRGEGFSEFVEQAKSFGLGYVVFPWIPPAERPADRAGFERLAERLNRMADETGRAGLRFGYHNHAFEFGRDSDGTRWLDILMRANHVQLELDVFWTAIGGVQPVDVLKQYGGRVAMLHLKDKAADAPATLNESAVARTSFRDVGSGSLDFRAILTAARAAGVQHFFVEHDYPPDPLASLRNSYAYLTRL
jgi:sugar phosphate isomerase/epimerase